MKLKLTYSLCKLGLKVEIDFEVLKPLCSHPEFIGGSWWGTYTRNGFLSPTWKLHYLLHMQYHLARYISHILSDLMQKDLINKVICQHGRPQSSQIDASRPICSYLVDSSLFFKIWCSLDKLKLNKNLKFKILILVLLIDRTGSDKASSWYHRGKFRHKSLEYKL